MYCSDDRTQSIYNSINERNKRIDHYKSITKRADGDTLITILFRNVSRDKNLDNKICKTLLLHNPENISMYKYGSSLEQILSPVKYTPEFPKIIKDLLAINLDYILTDDVESCMKKIKSYFPNFKHHDFLIF